MNHLWQDVRFGLRMLLKSPGFTAVAVISLALGIGANTTIFTLINAVFFNPLPVEDLSRLVSVFTSDEKQSGAFTGFMAVSYPNYEDYRDHCEAFSSLAAEAGVGVSITGGTGDPEQIFGTLVTGNYFDMLGVRFARGRGFLPEEDKVPGANPVTVLSDRLWKRRFGADPGLVGGTVSLNGRTYTVAGIAPEGFKGTGALGGPDLWVPTMMHSDFMPRDDWFSSRRALLFNLHGRLKPGVTIEQASASMKAVAKRLEENYPDDNAKRSVTLVPLAQAAINPNMRGVFVQAGGLLMSVVALVLLIACANVANLLLARATVRKREIAIRLSLGAGRARLVRQLLTEATLLSLIGGAAGLAVAVWGRDLLWAFRPPFFAPDGLDLGLNARVLGFTLAVSLVTGVLFGLMPALQASRSDLVTELKDKSSQPGRHNRRFGARNFLVMSQVALSLITLIGAGLFLRSLGEAQKIDPGFDAERLGVLSFDVAGVGYDRPRGEEFYRRMLERVATIPGVESASLSENPPLQAGFMRSVFPEGQAVPPDRSGILVLVNATGDGYFKTAGIPLMRGRDFNDADRDGAPQVVIVNETMGERFWPGQDAVGKRFKFHGDESFREIVGVARNSKYFNVGEDPQPFIYLPLRQNYEGAVTLFVRSAADPAVTLGTVRGEVQSMDRNMPLVGVATARDLIQQGFWAPRMGAALLAIFGLLALVLAAVGIYGVMSYSVNQRTQEIGIRMAMGAKPGDVLGLILRQGMTPVLIGVAAGLGVSLAAARLVSGLLFGVSATDPATFAGIPLLLAAVALAASYLPARRATRVDPMIALRYE